MNAQRRLNRDAQTGSSKGHFRRNDKHRAIDGILFLGYSGASEQWVTEDRMLELNQASARIRKAKRQERDNDIADAIKAEQMAAVFARQDAERERKKARRDAERDRKKAERKKANDIVRESRRLKRVKELEAKGVFNYNTNSERGTFHLGDEHPEHKGMFFKRYETRRGVLRENWCNQEKMDNAKNYEKLARLNRRAAIEGSKLEEGDEALILAFYAIRDAKNKAHGRIMYHVDHRIPLAKNGTHHPSNLQLATASWNLRKGKKII